MFRFTIRDVLWLTALVAMGVGWWMEHLKSGPEIASLRKENERLFRESSDEYARLLKAIKEAGPGDYETVSRLVKFHEVQIKAMRALIDVNRRERSLDPVSTSYEYMPAEPGEWQAKGRPTPR